MLVIRNFTAGIEGKEILHGIDLTIKPGEVHAIMGPNGSGKTTLAMSMMGHPGYNVKYKMSNTKCQINGQSILQLSPEQRVKEGLFVSFQQPIEITGVSLLAFLRTAYKALYPNEKIPLSQFKERVNEALSLVNLPSEFMQRSVNEGFSGGEKKRSEIAQMIVLKPKFAVLDEIDSGLDVDSLRIIAKAIAQTTKKEHTGILLITHYQRILHHIKPDYVHVLIDGIIRQSDGMALAQKIEEDGYAAI